MSSNHVTKPVVKLVHSRKKNQPVTCDNAAMCSVQYMTQVCREGPLIEVENYQDIIFKLCIFFTLGGDIHKQSHQN